MFHKGDVIAARLFFSELATLPYTSPPLCALISLCACPKGSDSRYNDRALSAQERKADGNVLRFPNIFRSIDLLWNESQPKVQ